MPGGGSGIGFDDLVFAASLRKVLVPGGATGNLELVDPDTFAITSIGGFSAAKGTFGGGHGDGTTSADEGRGLLFAVDRTAGKLDVVDPKAFAWRVERDDGHCGREPRRCACDRAHSPHGPRRSLRNGRRSRNSVGVRPDTRPAASREGRTRCALTQNGTTVSFRNLTGSEGKAP